MSTTATVKDIVRDYLNAGRFHGLCGRNDCACRLDDLMPCESPDIADCEPGYLSRNVDGLGRFIASSWTIQPERPAVSQ